MSMLGAKLIAHIIEYKCLSEVQECRIEPGYLIGQSKLAYEYLLDKVAQGSYPSFNEINQTFGIECTPTTAKADTSFLCELIKKRYVTNQLNPIFERATKFVEARDPEKAIEVMQEAYALRQILNAKLEKPHSFKYDIVDRLEQYEKAKKMNGILGFESRWESINEIGGWCPGIFYTIIGTSTSGKSWSEILIADDMSSQMQPDENILFITTEMAPVRLAKRLDCVKYKLPLRGLREGDLDKTSEDYWYEQAEKNLKGQSQFGNVILVGKKLARTVDDIVRLQKEHKSKAVLIDGGYRLDTTFGGDWNRQVLIIEQIQEATEETGVPWIVTSQENPSDAKSKGRGMYGARYAKEWSINPDVVLRVRDHQTRDDIKSIDILKWRDGEGSKKSFHIRWDTVKMDYSEIKIEKESKEVDVPDFL